MSNENFAPFDPAEHLETEEAIAGFLDGLMEDGDSDPAYVAQALDLAARARARIKNKVNSSFRLQ